MNSQGLAAARHPANANSHASVTGALAAALFSQSLLALDVVGTSMARLVVWASVTVLVLVLLPPVLLRVDVVMVVVEVKGMKGSGWMDTVAAFTGPSNAVWPPSRSSALSTLLTTLWWKDSVYSFSAKALADDPVGTVTKALNCVALCPETTAAAIVEEADWPKRSNTHESARPRAQATVST